MKKSKIQYKRWGISIGIIMLEGYMVFVWSKMLLQNNQTIQILIQKGDILEEKTVSSPIIREIPQKGEYSFVASKRGTYYYPLNCSKARTLSTKNMLYFKDKMSAEQAGYKAHKDCF